MTVFEIARIPAKSSADIIDPSHEQGAALQTVLDTLSKQPGFRSNVFGKDLDENNICYIITGWQSLQDHENFIAAEQYKPFFNAAGVFLAGGPVMRHVDIPSLDTLSKSSLGGVSILQVRTWFFPLNVDKTKIEVAFEGRREQYSGFIGGGWVKETLDGKCAFAAVSAGEHDASMKDFALDHLANGSEVSLIDITAL